MKSITLIKMLATSFALAGLLAGCAGSDTKDEASTETKPAVEQKADDSAQTDAAASTETQAASNDSAAAANASMAADSYEVAKGDNLWNISGKSEIYGDSFQWPLIYKANRDKIKDADLIHAGQNLSIDRSASQADIDAAINHAKTRGAWSLGSQEASDKAYLGE